MTARGPVVLLHQNHKGGSDADGIPRRHGALHFNSVRRHWRERAIPTQGSRHPRRDLPDPSLTLSDQQFLSGDAAAGRPVTVAGEFRVAQGTGKLPVVVLMHGSSGVGATTEAWVHAFNAMGISTFVIDGFTGRLP